MSTIFQRIERVYDEFWKQGKPFVRDFQGVPVLEDALASLSEHKFVIAREEYPRIWEHILSLRNEAVAAGQAVQDGLVITGHHGIGKSLFIDYALGAALTAHIPVVFCNNSLWCHIFDERGIKEFVFARDPQDRFDAPSHALYLVDSFCRDDSPPSVFLNRSGVLVQAVAPTHRAAWKWTERSDRAWFWIMDVWTRVEMQALQHVMEEWTPGFRWGCPGKEVYTLVELFDLVGPCPRQCVRYGGRAKTREGPKADLRNVYKPACVSFVFDLHPLLRAVRQRVPPPDFYEHHDIENILFLYNARPQKPARVPVFCYDVPTLFLREMLIHHVQGVWTTRTPPRIAAAVLAAAPSLAAAFYQPLLIEYLLETRAGRFCYIPESHNGYPTMFRLGPGLEHPRETIELRPGCPPVTDIENESILIPCPGFTAFDVAVITECKTRVTMLRMAVGTLEPKAASIHAAIEALESVLPHPETVKWSFIYAALDGNRARNLAESNIARTLEGLHPGLKVGWMKVGTLNRSTRALLDALESGPIHGEDFQERPAKRLKCYT